MLLHALTPEFVNRNNINMLILNGFVYIMYIVHTAGEIIIT